MRASRGSAAAHTREPPSTTYFKERTSHSRKKTFPSDARVLKQYNTELDIAAQLAVLNGDADTTEQFTTANAILLSDVSSYKEKLRSGAQAKRNASNCNGVDQR